MGTTLIAKCERILTLPGNPFANEIRKALNLSLGSPKTPRGTDYLEFIKVLEKELMNNRQLGLQDTGFFRGEANRAQRQPLIQEFKALVQSGYVFPLDRSKAFNNHC